MRAGRIIAAIGLSSIVAVLAIGFAYPDLSAGSPSASGGRRCAEARRRRRLRARRARTTRGRARLVWALFASGLVIWALTDALYGVALR